MEKWRRKCRTSLLPWCIEALEPQGFAPAKHHRLLIKYLERVIAGEIRRLMIFMPPGSAKSTYTTILTPPHLFARLPPDRRRVLGASHTANLAEDFSLKIHRIIRDNEETLGYGLANESRGRWYTTNGGEYLAAGVGGAIPGFRADFAIVDDPIKGRASADSEADRKTAWDWYNGDLLYRLTPDAPIVLMHTRWHEDDLAGRLLLAQPDEWTVLKLPAEAEENDQLGRQPGEWLWMDDDYRYGDSLKLAKKEAELNATTREWASQFQQRPRPAEGALFKVGQINILNTAPSGRNIARGWDLAATKKLGSRDPDYTAGVKLLRTNEGRYVVLHVCRERGGPDDVKRLVVNTAAQDKHDHGSVRIGLPQDPGQAGKAQVLDYTRILAGHIVDSVPVTGDKGTRAAPIASQVNVGNVDIVEGPWNRAFLDELAAFPSGAHDDMVDALSEAFRLIGLGPAPMRISDAALRAI
jgi:predicted phage terminase large subunit-like protein